MRVRLYLMVAVELDARAGKLLHEQVGVVAEWVVRPAPDVHDVHARLGLQALQVGERREEVAAVLDDLPRLVRETEERELAVVVRDSLGRPRERRNRRGSVLRPVDIAVRRPRRDEPVVAILVMASGLEPRLD